MSILKETFSIIKYMLNSEYSYIRDGAEYIGEKIWGTYKEQEQAKILYNLELELDKISNYLKDKSNQNTSKTIDLYNNIQDIKQVIELYESLNIKISENIYDRLKDIDIDYQKIEPKIKNLNAELSNKKNFTKNSKIIKNNETLIDNIDNKDFVNENLKQLKKELKTLLEEYVNTTKINQKENTIETKYDIDFNNLKDVIENINLNYTNKKQLQKLKDIIQNIDEKINQDIINKNKVQEQIIIPINIDKDEKNNLIQNQNFLFNIANKAFQDINLAKNIGVKIFNIAKDKIKEFNPIYKQAVIENKILVIENNIQEILGDSNYNRFALIKSISNKISNIQRLESEIAIKPEIINIEQKIIALNNPIIELTKIDKIIAEINRKILFNKEKINNYFIGTKKLLDENKELENIKQELEKKSYQIMEAKDFAKQTILNLEKNNQFQAISNHYELKLNLITKDAKENNYTKKIDINKEDNNKEINTNKDLRPGLFSRIIFIIKDLFISKSIDSNVLIQDANKEMNNLKEKAENIFRSAVSINKEIEYIYRVGCGEFNYSPENKLNFIAKSINKAAEDYDNNIKNYSINISKVEKKSLDAKNKVTEATEKLKIVQDKEEELKKANWVDWIVDFIKISSKLEDKQNIKDANYNMKQAIKAEEAAKYDAEVAKIKINQIEKKFNYIRLLSEHSKELAEELLEKMQKKEKTLEYQSQSFIEKDMRNNDIKKINQLKKIADANLKIDHLDNFIDRIIKNNKDLNQVQIKIFAKKVVEMQKEFSIAKGLINVKSESQTKKIINDFEEKLNNFSNKILAYTKANEKNNNLYKSLIDKNQIKLKSSIKD